MSRLLRDAKKLLRDLSVSEFVITASPPFVEITLKRTELESLLRSQAMISEIIATCVVRRRVFWEDLVKEDYEYARKSLEECEGELKQVYAKLISSNEESILGLVKFVNAWISEINLIRKRIHDRMLQISEEKSSDPSYDWANEDREKALEDLLLALRKSIYPLLSALIDFLADDDPTKNRARSLLDCGLNLIPDAALQRSVIPEIDAV